MMLRTTTIICSVGIAADVAVSLEVAAPVSGFTRSAASKGTRSESRIAQW